MKILWTSNQLTFAAIGGFIGWFWGGCDGLIYALITFVVIDYITGVMCAIVSKNLSSEIGFKGLFRKVLIFMLVGIANVVDMQIIGAGSALKIAVVFFYLSNEGISILENAAFLGVPIPDELKRVLKQIKHHDKDRKGKK